MNEYKVYEDKRLKVWVVKGPGVLIRVASYPEARDMAALLLVAYKAGQKSLADMF